MKKLLLFLLFVPTVSFSQTFELTNGQSIDLINPKKNIGIKNVKNYLLKDYHFFYNY